MKKLICVIFACLLLCGCQASAMEFEQHNQFKDKLFYVSRIPCEDNYSEPIYDSENEKSEIDFLKAIWVSQFDMHPIYRNGNKQRDKKDYCVKVEKIMDNLKKDGFNTIFLQVRPNGDSIYKSKFYPLSKYVAGKYGGNIDYDVIELFLKIAKKHEISVHAWINPFRLCSEQELKNYKKGIIYEWYLEGIGNRIEINEGILFLDPSYTEATELIINGADEILNKYDFDGIHLDDYFYPTEFEFDDEKEFLQSGIDSKTQFRVNNIDRTVKALFETAHKHNKIFGVAPAGNIYSLKEGWGVDIYKWCSQDGFLDYVMPQLYFGFENSTCPFETIIKDWSEAVTNKNIKLYVGLSAAKCVLGAEGKEDEFAGKGKFEWRDNNDILVRSMQEILNYDNTDGVCIFTYSSFYDPLLGNENELIFDEKFAFCELLKRA